MAPIVVSQLPDGQLKFVHPLRIDHFKDSRLFPFRTWNANCCPWVIIMWTPTMDKHYLTCTMYTEMNRHTNGICDHRWIWSNRWLVNLIQSMFEIDSWTNCVCPSFSFWKPTHTHTHQGIKNFFSWLDCELVHHWTDHCRRHRHRRRCCRTGQNRWMDRPPFRLGHLDIGFV